ncbi:hypothetical protein ACFRH6_01570 [Streptomyces sp. NPDC056749]|uniref:hypothetical protein n=1 Tax=Streptomyces sp. NPDC056749 TaxID=3345936 RepID=UPI00367D5170
MSTAPQVPDESRMKHIELLQTTISRLGTNSFLIKGWAMTVSGGLTAVAMGGAGWAVAVIALMMTAGFWLLDAYYLEQERLFRSLYERAVMPGATRVPLFSMDVERYAQHVPWRRVALSRTLTLFYGTFAVVDLAVVLVLLVPS